MKHWGRILLTAAVLLTGGQLWAEGEGDLLENMRPAQIKRGRGNVRLFVPRAETSSDDTFGSSQNRYQMDGVFGNSERESNDPTERCLMVNGAINARGKMGYLNFSLNFPQPIDFRGKALKCRFVNPGGNRPETIIVRFYKKDGTPVWIIQCSNPTFGSGDDGETEITFDPNSGGDFKAVVGKVPANDVARIEFFFGNQSNIRHNFRIMGLNVVQGEAAESEGGFEDGGGRFALNGNLMTRSIREWLSAGNGQAGFFENGDQSFIRIRGIPGRMEGLDGAWISFRLDFPQAVRLAGKRLDFRCESVGGAEKLIIRGWGDDSSQPLWSCTSTEGAFPANRLAEFRISTAEPRALTMPSGDQFNQPVRALEFLVSAPALGQGKELRAEFLNLELNAE